GGAGGEPPSRAPAGTCNRRARRPQRPIGGLAPRCRGGAGDRLRSSPLRLGGRGGGPHRQGAAPAARVRGGPVGRDGGTPLAARLPPGVPAAGPGPLGGPLPPARRRPASRNRASRGLLSRSRCVRAP